MKHTAFCINHSLIGRVKASNVYAALLLGLFLLSSAATTLLMFRPTEASITSPVVGGQVYGAGNDYYGTLGNGADDIVTSAARFQLPAGVTVQKVVQTQANIIVLGSDDQVYSSGRNANGEFGIGTQELQSTPVVFTLPGGVTATDVAAYYEDGTNTEDAIFVLGSDGNVYGAGSNYYGVLGNGGGAQVYTTPVVFQLPGGVTAVSMHPQKRNMLVIGSDGNLYGAGENAQGELGNGTAGRTATPVVFQLPGGVNVLDVAPQRVGISSLTTVIADDGNVYSAGQNNYGMFGDGTLGSKSTPVEFQLPIGQIAEEAYVSDIFIAVKTVSGDLYGAGDNSSGQLGDGTGFDSMVPVRFDLPVGVTVTSYVPNANAAAQGVIGSDGSFYIAGANYYGIVGDGTYDDALSPVEFDLPVGVSAVKAQMGDSTLVLGSDGNAYVTGGNYWGQTGTGIGTLDTEYTTPQRFGSPVGQAVTDIEQNQIDATFTSFVVVGTTIYGSGSNGSGAIGNGSMEEYVETPSEMQLPVGVSPKSIHPNSNGETANTCVISMVDDLYCVGINLYGQLGSGQQVTYAATPQNFQLPAGLAAVKMLSVYDSMFVLATDGNVYGAGSNQYGQLGDGTVDVAYTPVRYGLPVGVTAVDIYRTGLTFISVRGNDGNIYSAGNNYSGMFGAGITGQQATPVVFQLPGGVSVVDVAKVQTGAGATPLVVIGDDGNAYAAGINNYGQVGSGSLSSSVTTPQQVALPGGVSAVSATTDPSGTYILGSDGNVYGAGRNNYGQLGDGSMTLRRSPVVYQLPGGVSAVGIANDRESTFVLGDDGNVYGAGRNNYGQLGDASVVNRSTPVVFQLPGGQTVSSMSDVLPFQQQRVSVRTSTGDVYSAGNNSLNDFNLTAHAPFGNGTPNANESTPVQFQMPGGVTVSKLSTGTSLFNLAVIGSDGNLYASGVNLAGFSVSAPYASSTPIQMELPGGETVVSARSEYRATYVITSTGNLYGAGCNNFTVMSEGPISGCAGWLGYDSYLSPSTPQRYELGSGLRAESIDIEARGRTFVLTEPTHAVGSQLYCDANANSTFDGEDTYLNGGTIDLYASFGGSATGPVLASYDSANYVGDDGTVFFDGLPAGEYILGATINGTTTIYSTAFTLDGSGDGWILGGNPLIDSGPLFSVTGSDCTDIIVLGGGAGPGTPGGGTTPPPSSGGGTSTPGTPSGTGGPDDPLQETGKDIAVLIATASVLVASATALLVRKKFI